MNANNMLNDLDGVSNKLAAADTKAASTVAGKVMQVAAISLHRARKSTDFIAGVSRTITGIVNVCKGIADIKDGARQAMVAYTTISNDVMNATKRGEIADDQLV